MNIRNTSFSRWASRTALLALVMSLGTALVAQEADARRLGGGKGFGRQSSNVTQPASPARDAGTAAKQQPAQNQQAGQPAPGAQQPARSRWGGMVGGLLAGLGIAALLSHFGLGGALAQMLGSVLMIGLLVLAGLFVWRMLRGGQRGAPAQPILQPAQAPMQPSLSALRTGEAQPGSVAATLHGASSGNTATAGTATVASSSTASSANWSVPADFDTATFLRSAKVHFLRLQAAWDAKNLDDIREFTTPEVFAEIRMQMSEARAGGGVDVDPLDAELLGIETTDTDYLASVRFSGKEREGQGAAEPFVEIWNLSKPVRGDRGWLLAGIQQLQ